MDNRPQRRALAAASWTGAFLLLASLAVLNFIAARAFLRLDLSAGKVYSISDGTKTLLRGLKDNLIIKVYFTPRLPGEYGLNEQYLRDLLGEYKSAGRGKVLVEFLDPGRDERIKQEAQSAGVVPVRLSVMSRDKFELKETYMGLVLLYKGKTEVIAGIENRSEFEYNITRRIKKLTAASLKTVGFTSGHGEKAPFDPQLRAILDEVREQAVLETVSLEKPIPAAVEALWIVSPRKPFSAGELERLKAWVGSGGSLGLLLDRRDVDLNSFMTTPVQTGLDDLLSSWGVQPMEGFVADQQSERVQVQQRQGIFTFMNVVEYPFLPVATRFNTKHPASRGLEAVAFPFVHPVTVTPPAGSDLSYTSVADSTDYSWYDVSPRVSPMEPREPASAKKGPFSLAGVLEGNFHRVTPSTYTAVEGRPTVPAPGRVVLIGTSRFLHATFSPKPANLALFMNLLEWTLRDESLLSIRAKGMTHRPLRPLPDAARLVLKNFLVLCLPLLVLAAALISYSMMARRRKSLALLYAESSSPQNHAPTA